MNTKLFVKVWKQNVSTKNEKPKGLLKIQSLSDRTSESPTWHLPLVLIGMFMSFIFNVGAYTIYFVSFILGYVGTILNWIYERIILPVVKVIYRIAVMIIDVLLSALRLIIRYFITIPIDIFLAVIGVVPSVVNWQSYVRSFKVVAAGFLAYAVLEFISHLTGMKVIGEIGGPFCLAIAVTWVVGLVSFDSHEKGKKAAMFAVSVVGLILVIAALIVGPNQLDDIHGWGGLCAGLFYSPSVLAVVMVLALVLTMVFITNVGAIYINTSGESADFKSRIKGVASESFKRCWYFLLQPLFVMVIGGILSIIPYYVVNYSTEQLNDSVVGKVMTNNNTQLNEELEANTISNRTDWILNDTLTDAEFRACLDTLSNESDLKLRISENSVYQGYYAMTIPLRNIPEKVMSKESIEDAVKSIKDQIKNLEEVQSNETENFDKQLENMRGYGADAKSIAKTEQKRKRTKEMRQSQIASAKSELNYRESSNIKYNITYLLFLLGKAVLFSVILTLLVNTYAYSVKPIYDMHNSSYLVSEVKALNAKDRMQPWIGILLIVALSGGYFMGGSYVDTLWGEVSGMWSDSGVSEQSDAGIEVVNDAVVEVEVLPEEAMESDGMDGMWGDGMEGMEMDDMDEMDMYDMEMEDMEWEEDMYDELERLSAFRCDYCGQKSCEGDCQY